MPGRGYAWSVPCGRSVGHIFHPGQELVAYLLEFLWMARHLPCACSSTSAAAMGAFTDLRPSQNAHVAQFRQYLGEYLAMPGPPWKHGASKGRP